MNDMGPGKAAFDPISGAAGVDLALATVQVSDPDSTAILRLELLETAEPADHLDMSIQEEHQAALPFPVSKVHFLRGITRLSHGRLTATDQGHVVVILNGEGPGRCLLIVGIATDGHTGEGIHEVHRTGGRHDLTVRHIAIH